MIHTSPRLLLAFLGLTGGLIIPVWTQAVEDIRYSMLMDQGPDVSVPPKKVVFSPKYKPLWIEALAQPDSDLQRRVAESIARVHGDGLADLRDTAGPLIETLSAKDQHPVVRLACARALTVLDAQEAAPALFQRALEDGTEMSLIVEPVLARWKFEPIRETWLGRLSSPTTPRKLKLAMQGLAEAGEKRAVEPLRARMRSSFERPDLRLVAARALGKLVTEGLEADARQLAAGSATLDRLIAAEILRAHAGSEAAQLLLELAQDASPTVASTALRRLVEIDPASVATVAEPLLKNAEGQVRLLTGRALAATADPAAIPRLVELLADDDPSNRVEFRQLLLRLAREHTELDGPVREAVLARVADESGRQWHGLEQTVLMLIVLDHKPAASHLARLLDHPNYRVFIPAAWGLRQLAVPETLPAMLDKARDAIKGDSTSRSPDVDLQIAFLMEGFGLMKYRDAELVLLQCVPKNGFRIGAETRAAAIWSLGHFYAGNASPELGAAFAERLTDTPPMGIPEVERVRVMSAIGIGRMKYAEGIDALLKYYKGQPINVVSHACGWAHEQITGEKVASPAQLEVEAKGFVIEPINP